MADRPLEDGARFLIATVFFESHGQLARCLAPTRTDAQTLARSLRFRGSVRCRDRRTVARSSQILGRSGKTTTARSASSRASSSISAARQLDDQAPTRRARGRAAPRALCEAWRANRRLRAVARARLANASRPSPKITWLGELALDEANGLDAGSARVAGIDQAGDRVLVVGRSANGFAIRLTSKVAAAGLFEERRRGRGPRPHSTARARRPVSMRTEPRRGVPAGPGPERARDGPRRRRDGSRGAFGRPASVAERPRSRSHSIRVWCNA